MNGYGIADLVSLECMRDHRTKQIRSTRLVAFEMKISDWRKAIQQGYRYKFFANKSIVVLPLAELKRASKLIQTFKVLNLGLWGYDVEKQIIVDYYSPPIKRAFNPQARKKAIEIVKSIL